MHNKKIFNTLKDAINSPIGSTKRKAARNMITIMRRVTGDDGSSSYGGQGGPGNSKYSPTSIGSASYVTKAPRKDPDYSNMVIFPSPPAPRRGRPLTDAQGLSYGNFGHGSNSAQQNETDQLGANAPQTTPYQPPQQNPVAASNFPQINQLPDMTGAYGDVTGTSSVNNSLAGIQSALTTGLAGKGGPGMPNLSSLSSGGMPNLSTLSPSGSSSSLPAPSTQYASLLPQTAPSSSSSTSFPNLFSSIGNFFSDASNKGSTLINNARYGTPLVLAPKTTPTPVTPPTPAGPISTPIPAAARATPSSQYPNITSGGQTTAPVSTPVSAPTPTSTPTPTPVTVPTPAPTPNPATTPTQVATPNYAQLAVDSNMGATAFAGAAMNDPEILRAVLGPNVDTSMVNTGSLTQAIKNLQNSMIDTSAKPDPTTGKQPTYQQEIGSMQQQLLQMTADGGIIGPMLQTYIQNKDTSLNAIHNAQLGAQDAMLHIDQGDPAQVAIWNRYSDYLNNIYTAQNASYADFFNKSTTMYSNALSALNTTLTTTINAYNNLLTPAYTGLESDYNNIKQSLEDAYTAAQNAPLQSVQLATLQNQLALSNLQLAAAGVPQTSSDYIPVYKKYTDAGQYFTNVKPNATDKVGNVGFLSPSVTDLTPVVDELSQQSATASGPQIGVGGALSIVTSAMQKALSAAGSPENSLKLASTYMGLITNAATEPSTLTGAPVLSKEQSDAMQAQLGLTVGKSVYNYLYNPSSSINRTGDAKNAFVDAYVGTKGWWGLGSASMPTQSEFTSKYSGTLGYNLANEIWGAVTAQKNVAAQMLVQDPNYYGQGTTLPMVYQGWADTINKMSDPSTIADWTGTTVASLFGATNVDVTAPMTPIQTYDPTTMDTTSTDTFGGPSYVDPTVTGG